MLGLAGPTPPVPPPALVAVVAAPSLTLMIGQGEWPQHAALSVSFSPDSAWKQTSSDDGVKRLLLLFAFSLTVFSYQP